MISIITATYNRAHTLPRAIESVLRQDYPDWELIIVDDGSTDNTAEVLARYQDPRIRVLKHDRNRGVMSARNTGLDHIRGEWFTLLDSDDEMVVPNALSTLLSVPWEIDPAIDAITCNCIDSVSGKFTGLGLDHDQYLDAETIMRRCRHEFWGLTKTSLLQGERFTVHLPATENVLWHKIDLRAHRYYIHEGLRIFHREGEDRTTAGLANWSSERIYKGFVELLDEGDFLRQLRTWSPQKYRDKVFNAALSFIAVGDRQRAWQAFRRLASCPGAQRQALITLSGILFGPGWLRFLKGAKTSLRRTGR